MGRLSLWVLFGLVLFAVSFNDAQVSAEVGPTESQCKPYIEKAIKELQTDKDGDDDEDGPPSGETVGGSTENADDDDDNDDDNDDGVDSKEANANDDDDDNNASTAPNTAEVDDDDDDDGDDDDHDEANADSKADDDDDDTDDNADSKAADDDDNATKEDNDGDDDGDDEDDDNTTQEKADDNDDDDEANTKEDADDGDDATTEQADDDEDGKSDEAAAAEKSGEGDNNNDDDDDDNDNATTEDDDNATTENDGDDDDDNATKEKEADDDDDDDDHHKSTKAKAADADDDDDDDDQQKSAEGDTDDDKDDDKDDDDDDSTKEKADADDDDDDDDATKEKADTDDDDDDATKEKVDADDHDDDDDDGDDATTKEDGDDDDDDNATKEKDDKDDDDDDDDNATKEKDDDDDDDNATQEKADDDDDDDDNATQEKADDDDDDDGASKEAKKDDDDEDSKGAKKEVKARSKRSVGAQPDDDDDDDDDATKEKDDADDDDDDDNATQEKDDDGDDDDDDDDETDGDDSTETQPEDDLLLEEEIPENLRDRSHISELLHLDDEFEESEQALDKVADTILKDIKRIYENAVKPLETLFKYRDLSNRHFSDPEIFSKPLVLFMGPWSGGKSSIINYLTNNEFKTNSLRTGAEPSPAYFNILMWGNETEVLDGTQLAADYTFSGLQKFGQGLEERLRGLKMPNPLLEKVNIVEIPGILEVRKQVSRVFPFNDACQWFIDRADIIFLVYDPAKLDVGPETEAILDQLKGREYQTKILLNKADTIHPEELLRVQSALIWNISPLMSSAQPPVMYTTSLWSRPYESNSPVRLLQAQERAFLRDLRTAIEKRIENRIASARRFAVRVRNHAKMVDCYLNTYYNHKSIFGNKKKISDQIIENPQNYHIYEGLSTLTNISRYDLPDPDVYRGFFRLNPLYEFKKLSETCTYFRGCPIQKLDVAIAYDLPELVGKYKKMAEHALNHLDSTDSDSTTTTTTADKANRKS